MIDSTETCPINREVVETDTTATSDRSNRQDRGVLTRQLHRLRGFVVVTALALVGVTLAASDVAEASVRGTDGTVYQVLAGCDPFLDVINLHLTPNWGNKPMTTFQVWSYDEGRFIGSGVVPTYNTLRFPYGTKGTFAIKVTYTWVYSNLTTWSHTEWLPSYTITSILGSGYRSSVCYL